MIITHECFLRHVTIDAFRCLGVYSMKVMRRIVVFRFVTAQTQQVSFQFQFSRMRIMATRATLLHRGVGEFAIFHIVCLISMAGEAYFVTRGHEKLGKVSLMGVMTCAAATYSNRSVNEFASCQRAVVA